MIHFGQIVLAKSM
jgi:hypothetical protein